MKNIFYLFTFFMLNSCVDQQSSDIDFTLFNQTDKTVKIQGFDTELDINNIGKAEPIIINPNSKFSVTRFTGLGSNTSFRFYSIIGVDSVRIIFNNEKVLGLTIENTFDQGQTIFQGDENNQHFITEQDYESAEDCNDNCE